MNTVTNAYSIEKAGDISGIYRVAEGREEGTYSLFPGVTLFFQELSPQRESVAVKYADGSVLIEYCAAGRREFRCPDGRRFYLGAGEACIHKPDREIQSEAISPTRHYRGATIALQGVQNGNFLQMLHEASVDIGALFAAADASGGVCMISNDQKIVRIFEDICGGDAQEKIGYYKVKLLELLLLICGKDLSCSRLQYLPGDTATLLKQVEAYLWEHLSDHITIQKLAETFCMSQSSLKSSFRIAYGYPIHAYLHMCRMEVAAERLIKTSDKIGDIAHQSGYNSESKFSKAFFEFSGRTPRAYRKEAVQREWEIGLP